MSSRLCDAMNFSFDVQEEFDRNGGTITAGFLRERCDLYQGTFYDGVEKKWGFPDGSSAVYDLTKREFTIREPELTNSAS
jgi:hypothetical protein